MKLLKHVIIYKKKLHPDANPNSNTEHLSKIINEAKESVLKSDFS